MLILIMVVGLYCGQAFNLLPLNTKLQTCRKHYALKVTEAMRGHAVPPAPPTPTPWEVDSGIKSVILSILFWTNQTFILPQTLNLYMKNAAIIPLLLPSYTTALFFPSPQSQSSPTSDMGTLGQAVLLEFFSVASVSYNVFTQPLKSSFLLALLLK